MSLHVISRRDFAVAVGMLVSGLLMMYFISPEFSETAEFESNSVAIVPAATVPAFVVGLLLLAIGAVEFFSSISL
jgi:hypothetical protein